MYTRREGHRNSSLIVDLGVNIFEPFQFEFLLGILFVPIVLSFHKLVSLHLSLGVSHWNDLLGAIHLLILLDVIVSRLEDLACSFSKGIADDSP